MKNKSLLNRLVTNDISLMILSVLLALVIWFIINAGSDVESSAQINNVPINIELSDEAQNDGLRVFIGGDKTASVEVSGNRLIVGSLSSSDIQVFALDTDFIKSPDYYNLELAARKNGVKSNYSIEKITPSSIRIYVDRFKEKKFEIKDEIHCNINSETEYYENRSMSVASVTVSGPETIINRIDRVAIKGELSGELNKITSDIFDLVFVDKDNNEIEVSMLELSTAQVKFSVEPLPVKTIKLDVDVINAPSEIPDIKLDVESIKVAAIQSILDDLGDTPFVIGKLDFSDFDTKLNKVKMDIVLPTGCINRSDIKEVNVEIDLSGYSKKNLTIDTFKTLNLDTKVYNAKFQNSFQVTVCGPRDQIYNISSDDIVALGDFEGKLDEVTQKEFSLHIPFVFEINKEYKDCFVTGKYSELVNVSKK